MVRTVSVVATAAVVASASAAIIPGCTKTDQKAMGADGQPRIDWRDDGCCDAKATLQSKRGEWGLFCTIGGSQSKADEEAEKELRSAVEAKQDETEDKTPNVAAAAANAAADDKDIGTTEGDEAATAIADDKEVMTTDGDEAAMATGDDKAVVTAEGDEAATAAADDKAVTTDEDDEEDIAAEATATADTAAGETAEPLTDGIPDASSDASDEDDGSACFPSDATVELADGSKRAMAELAVGDMVKVGVNEYSRVFMFTHKTAGITQNFVELTTEGGETLRLTKGHYLYVDGEVVAASEVKVGSVLALGNGSDAVVKSVGKVAGEGLYNPQTVHGEVVVNGVRASTYTTAVEPGFAHAILAPFRALDIFGWTLTALESGNDMLAGAAPSGNVVA